MILFQDVKRENSTCQTSFTGIPFVILGKKIMYCTHGVDSYISTKQKILEEKIEKLRTIVNFPL